MKSCNVFHHLYQPLSAVIKTYVATKEISADFKLIVETVQAIVSDSNAMKIKTTNKNEKKKSIYPIT